MFTKAQQDPTVNQFNPVLSFRPHFSKIYFDLFSPIPLSQCGIFVVARPTFYKLISPFY
jgi:hypothetical protein